MEDFFFMCFMAKKCLSLFLEATILKSRNTVTLHVSNYPSCIYTIFIYAYLQTKSSSDFS